jgi:hypothetical protein
MAGQHNIAKTNLRSVGLSSLAALKSSHQSPELRPRFQRRGLCFAIRPAARNDLPGSSTPIDRYQTSSSAGSAMHIGGEPLP